MILLNSIIGDIDISSGQISNEKAGRSALCHRDSQNDEPLCCFTSIRHNQYVILDDECRHNPLVS
jgi:hypothetical protein